MHSCVPQVLDVALVPWLHDGAVNSVFGSGKETGLLLVYMSTEHVK
jgi:hypothetical protein